MKKGLLWFDNDPVRSLEDKVERAVRRYREKYGRSANTCYVHLSALAEARDVGTVRVSPQKYVLRHHFFVGEEEAT
jgi:hypothetical protein